MSLAARSWLYVSGARPEHFDKALACGADAIVLDLEDSVADAHKDRARDEVAAFLARSGGEQVFVRINAVGSEYVERDIDALGPLPLGGIRLPKAESRDDVELVAGRIAAFGRDVEVQPLIESALGLRSMAELLAPTVVHRVAIGGADLCADLRIGDRQWLLPLYIDVVVASRAAGCEPPILGVHACLDDEAALRDSTTQGRAMGFFGRSAIHPRQIAVINAAFTPTVDEVRAAEAVVDALAEGRRRGHGAIRLPNGKMADLADERLARHILAIGLKKWREA